jgi:hypothetical protein
MFSITTALAVLVVSVTDVAVIVTSPPAGVVAGAVYTVAAPLAVGDTLNEPHVPAGAQLHVTMPPASFVVVAATEAVRPVCSVTGGGVVIVIPTGGGVIVTVSFAVLILSVTEVAVIVTLLPIGIVAGAVYKVAAPLAVDATLNVPQAAAGVQLQFTEGLAGSFTVVAAIDTAVLIGNELGAGVVIVIDGAGMVTEPFAVFVLSVIDAAVIVTLPPVGTADGAV